MQSANIYFYIQRDVRCIRICVRFSFVNMAKRQSIVWKHFKKIRINDRLYGQCKYCKKQYQTHAGRMRRHLSVCQTCPLDTKTLFLDKESVAKKSTKNSSLTIIF